MPGPTGLPRRDLNYLPIVTGKRIQNFISDRFSHRKGIGKPKIIPGRRNKEIMDLALEELYKRETGAPFTDSLTGLFNHGFFQITLEREVKRSERHGDPFTLALIDIDSFALFNKRHGSVEGDRVLREIVSLIMKNIRQVDLAARYSGDVLAVILIKSNTQSALIAGERIRQAV
ncbi:MAG: GGDEF domain-containing protein, partial [Proteobacteria bacterium]|nr:GGDEF domain-containing protein [Pseudomonadota bacterium]